MIYVVVANKTFTNQYGMVMEEPSKEISSKSSDKAVAAAKELFEEGGYSSIYIGFAHPEEAQCYYNPIHGHQTSGKNWVGHFE